MNPCPSCTPSTSTSEYYYFDGLVLKKGTLSKSVLDDCSENIVFTNEEGIVTNPIPQRQVPQAVIATANQAPAANLQIEFSEMLLYSASTETALMRIRQYQESTGTWQLRYENLDGTAYAGILPPDLEAQTAQVNVTRTAVLGNNGSANFIQRETVRYDAETGAIESTVTDWIDSNGTVSVTKPVGFSLGELSATSAPTAVSAGGLGIIAGTASGAFAGAPASVSTAAVTGLQSITVSARGVTDGIVSANQVKVTLPNGDVFTMFDGQTFTWSVTKPTDSQLTGTYLVAATGAAYANISYTFK